MEHITFETMPKAIEYLIQKVNSLEARLMAKSQDENENFNVDQASKFLDLTPASIYTMVCKGQLPHSKKGRRLYFSKSELQEWLNSGKRKTFAELAAETRK